MNIQQLYSRAQTEDNIQKAIIALQLKEFKSIRLAADHFEVPKSTLADRMSGKKTRTVAHEIEPALSNAEENTLARWIIRLTATGFPATPMLIKEMAEEVHETGFAVGETQSTHIIVDSTLKSNWKVTAGKQEWITVLECIDADGGALPPMIIFKAKNTNSSWIPKDTPTNWHFSTSNSGWTSNSHGF
ncbi:hypothetical protein V491_00751, partial [Pseudogymnoascus sp. VKM F-3775]